MRDSNYLDGLIAGGLVAISFAGLILLIVSDLNNEAETEKKLHFMNGPIHTVKKLKKI